MSGRVADLTLGDLWVRARRYRPMVVTLVLTLAVLRVAPDGGPGSDAADIDAPTPIAAPVADPPAAGPGTGAPDAPASGSSTMPVPVAPSRPDRGAPSDEVRPAPPGPTPSGGQDVGVPPADDGPAASVRHTGWASLAAGTPLAALGVPAEALPVGNRLGRLDKASFLRLDGSWSSLLLAVDPEGSSRPLGDVGLQACAITTPDWEPGGERSFDDAPEWSADCVDGVEGDVGWEFAVAAIDIRHGVAILPGPEAPVEFQVALVDPRSGRA